MREIGIVLPSERPAVIELRGPFVGEEAKEQIGDAFLGAVSGGWNRIIVICDKIYTIDQHGTTGILNGYESVRRSGGMVAFVSPGQELADTLGLGLLGNSFKMYSHLDDAFRALMSH